MISALQRWNNPSVKVLEILYYIQELKSPKNKIKTELNVILHRHTDIMLDCSINLYYYIYYFISKINGKWVGSKQSIWVYLLS